MTASTCPIFFSTPPTARLPPDGVPKTHTPTPRTHAQHTRHAQHTPLAWNTHAGTGHHMHCFLGFSQAHVLSSSGMLRNITDNAEHHSLECLNACAWNLTRWPCEALEKPLEKE